MSNHCEDGVETGEPLDMLRGTQPRRGSCDVTAAARRRCWDIVLEAQPPGQYFDLSFETSLIEKAKKAAAALRASSVVLGNVGVREALASFCDNVARDKLAYGPLLAHALQRNHRFTKTKEGYVVPIAPPTFDPGDYDYHIVAADGVSGAELVLQNLGLWSIEVDTSLARRLTVHGTVQERNQKLLQLRAAFLQFFEPPFGLTLFCQAPELWGPYGFCVFFCARFEHLNQGRDKLAR